MVTSKCYCDRIKELEAKLAEHENKELIFNLKFAEKAFGFRVDVAVIKMRKLQDKLSKAEKLIKRIKKWGYNQHLQPISPRNIAKECDYYLENYCVAFTQQLEKQLAEANEIILLTATGSAKETKDKFTPFWHLAREYAIKHNLN
jgi:hypothetical protein